jgi:hypothetical protein
VTKRREEERRGERGGEWVGFLSEEKMRKSWKRRVSERG